MVIKESVFHPTSFCKLRSEAAQRMSVKGAWLWNVIFLLISHSLIWVMYQIQGKPYLIPEAFWGTCEAGYGFAQGCDVAV